MIGVDSSKLCVDLANESARLNGFEKGCTFHCDDARSFLGRSMERGEVFDMICIDPPAFVKKKKDIPVAKRAYIELNLMAFHLIREGGVIATSSCSFHLKEDMFLDIIRMAAYRSGREMAILKRGYQAPDHPVHPAIPESSYLKCLFLRVL